jgi:uncharacterized protein (TIGR02996 family)
MSDEDALLAAITAQPEEDTPRLAYADWLDEHADATPDPELARIRAEFIRVQVERLRCPYWLPGHTERYAQLSRREQTIQSRYTGAILGANYAGGIEVWFSRGFPCLRMRVGTFLMHAHRFEQFRAPQFVVTGAVENWYELVTHPQFPIVTNLTMVLPSGSPDARGSAQWSLDGAVIGRIGELARHNRLRGLDLSWCFAGDKGVFCLTEHPDTWRLEDLDLSHNDIEYAGLMELLLSPITAVLRRVNLCGNRITDRGARALADRWPVDGPLKWLRLEGTEIGPDGAAALRARFGEKVEL